MKSLLNFLTFLSIFISLLSIPLISNGQWVQKGGDVDGEAAFDRSGWSVSMADKNTMAIGAPENDGNGIDAGHVKVYKWSGSSWVQKGADIDGEAAGDEFGYSVSMPDTNTVAIGAPNNDGNGTNSGHVRVYKWSGLSWVQKGQEIDGEIRYDLFGRSVDMPDSNTVAIGAIANDGNGIDAGHVRIYRWTGSSWVQKGIDIDGEYTQDNSGRIVNMPDSNTIAIGADGNDGNGNSSGHVRVYKWSGTSWIQKGQDLDGEDTTNSSGYGLSMPDSNTVAIGAPYNDGNGVNSGHVRIYEWNGTNWVQKGLDIDGEAAYDNSGAHVSMPNSNTVTIGAIGNDGNGINSGHVRIYRWINNAWTQMGIDIDGEFSRDLSGYSMSMPDTSTIAIGAPQNDGNGASSGHVRVYRLGTITALKKIENKDNFILYPNPTKGQINLETFNSIGEVIQISSISGKVLKEITISQYREVIDLSNFDNGIYFLRMGNSTKKIVKID